MGCTAGMRPCYGHAFYRERYLDLYVWPTASTAEICSMYHIQRAIGADDEYIRVPLAMAVTWTLWRLTTSCVQRKHMHLRRAHISPWGLSCELLRVAKRFGRAERLNRPKSGAVLASGVELSERKTFLGIGGVARRHNHFVSWHPCRPAMV